MISQIEDKTKTPEIVNPIGDEIVRRAEEFLQGVAVIPTNGWFRGDLVRIAQTHQKLVVKFPTLEEYTNWNRERKANAAIAVSRNRVDFVRQHFQARLVICSISEKVVEEANGGSCSERPAEGIFDGETWEMLANPLSQRN